MKDFSKGKIYRIIGNGKTYYGSTCEPTLARRLAKHKSNYNDYLKGKRNFITSFYCLEGNNDYSIILVENYPCNNSDELRMRERHYIENNNCVNKVMPIRSEDEKKLNLKIYASTVYRDKHNERMKVYRKNNKNKVTLYKKNYYQKNKEKISEKITCECGSVFCKWGKSNHEKSAKHKEYVRITTLTQCLIDRLSYQETKQIMLKL